MASSGNIKNIIAYKLLAPAAKLLTARTMNTTDVDDATCTELHKGDLIISRTALIIALTILAFIISTSWVTLAAFIIRERARHQRIKAAKQWGRKSRFDARISIMRKEVDDQFSRQFSGCLHHEPENPCLGSDSPVELMHPERVWEVAAEPAKATKNQRKSKAISLFFDNAVNLWIPKR